MKEIDRDKVFFDTNILVYANDSGEPVKQKIARNLIKKTLEEQNGVISVQVLSEFWVTVTQKIKTAISEETAGKQLELFELMDIVDLTLPVFKDALILKERYRLSYWDSLIVSAAFSAGCTRLYSEDFNNGQVIQGVEILNPFAL